MNSLTYQEVLKLGSKSGYSAMRQSHQGTRFFPCITPHPHLLGVFSSAIPSRFQEGHTSSNGEVVPCRQQHLQTEKLGIISFCASLLESKENFPRIPPQSRLVTCPSLSQSLESRWTVYYKLIKQPLGIWTLKRLKV